MSFGREVEGHCYTDMLTHIEGSLIFAAVSVNETSHKKNGGMYIIQV